MFRKPASQFFCHPQENNFTYTDDYESVMQFVSKNQEIPTALEQFASSQEDLNNLIALTDAIKEGNFHATIFSHTHCQLYSLALLKNKKISITDFLMINLYLCTLMQFTDLQPMHEDDHDVKRITEVKVIDLDEVKNNLIKNVKIKYFDSHLYQALNESQLENNFSHLGKFDRAIIKIKIPPKPYDAISCTIMEYSLVFPFVFCDKKYFYVPSIAIMDLILKTINNDPPIKIAPIFGQLNFGTLFQMHQKGFHPVSLYSKHVKSNPKEVHNSRIGMTLVLLHDYLAHFYWGNLLTKAQHAFLFDYFIPKTARLLNLTIDMVLNQISPSVSNHPSLFKLIDLDIQSRLINIEKNDQQFYLFESIWNVLGYKKENAVKIVKMLYHDREIIQAQYKIDIVTTLNDPFFQKHPSGIKELTLSKMVEEEVAEQCSFSP